MLSLVKKNSIITFIPTQITNLKSKKTDEHEQKRFN